MKRTALFPLLALLTGGISASAGPTNAPNRSPSLPSLPSRDIFTVTAYCPCRVCCGRWAGGPTASGQRPRPGLTVAGPRALPLGTRVRIEGLGERLVQDRLARKYDARFDVFFASHAEAKQFGRRQLAVEILK